MAESERKLKLLLGFINSNVISFYIKEKNSSYSFNGGVTFTKDMINAIPIKQITKEQEETILSCVDSLLKERNKDKFEKLNQEIYKLYKLNPDEISIIESKIKNKE